jgi:hypothetical protein
VDDDKGTADFFEKRTDDGDGQRAHFRAFFLGSGDDSCASRKNPIPAAEAASPPRRVTVVNDDEKKTGNAQVGPPINPTTSN